MSYRTFKRVLGETSLERKCRFLFGACLLLLILSSFLWCGRESEKFVYDKTRSNSRHLVGSVLLKLHAERLESNSEERQLIREMASDLEDLVYEGSFIALEPVDHPHVIPPGASKRERQILNELKADYEQQLGAARRNQQLDQNGGETESESENAALDERQIYETYKDLLPVFRDRKMDAAGEYHYYQPVYWKESCLSCHKLIHSEYLGDLATAADADPQEVLARMPFRVVRIVLPNRGTQRAISRIRAFLIAMGIVTVFLSMIALYIIVRYVIVKPLQHLQEVSESIRKGNYDARARIETRDEFEDLAGSFNRMLRHMVDTQGELQTANANLDLKVDELARANMQLYEVNRLKSEFLANVSHELRTPLNSIIGFSDVLKNLDSLNEKQKRYANNIGSSGKVLLEMINDILDLAKMESGKMQVQPSEFSVGAVAKAQIDVVQGLAADKNIDISFHCPPDLPDVFQDQAKVQQILTNLLSNAIKFTPEGGRISVTVQPEGDPGSSPPERLSLTVEDTGIGIAEEDHEIIFEKFRQATPHQGSDNLTREFSGTGLGLSIIKELCKLLGGEVTFESQLGQGSAFTVILPWILSTRQASTSDTMADLHLREVSPPGFAPATRSIPITTAPLANLQDAPHDS